LLSKRWQESSAFKHHRKLLNDEPMNVDGDLVLEDQTWAQAAIRSLARYWDTPDEDVAWAYLQTDDLAAEREFWHRLSDQGLALGNAKMKVLNYRTVLRKEPEGGYTASIPSLPGCVTHGKTVDHALTMAKEAIELCVQSLEAHGAEVSG